MTQKKDKPFNDDEIPRRINESESDLLHFGTSHTSPEPNKNIAPSPSVKKPPRK